jgi:hypothetical protein
VALILPLSDTGRTLAKHDLVDARDGELRAVLRSPGSIFSKRSTCGAVISPTSGAQLDPDRHRTAASVILLSHIEWPTFAHPTCHGTGGGCHEATRPVT